MDPAKANTCTICGTTLDLSRHHGRCAACGFAEALMTAAEASPNPAADGGSSPEDGSKLAEDMATTVQLARQASLPSPAVPEEEWIGPYRLIEELGKGGFG